MQDILLQIKDMAKLIHTLADHSDDVNCCAFSSSLLATCSLDKTIRLYFLSDFTELPLSPLKFHTYAVHCCCFKCIWLYLERCCLFLLQFMWMIDSVFIDDYRQAAILLCWEYLPSPQSRFMVAILGKESHSCCQ